MEDGISVSVASNLFQINSHSVKFKIDIENHTDQELEVLDKFQLPGSEGEWGEIPQSVLPGKRESSFGHKQSDTATGKYSQAKNSGKLRWLTPSFGFILAVRLKKYFL